MCNNSNKVHLGAANEPPVIDIIQPYLDVIYISMKEIKEFAVNNFSLNYCWITGIDWGWDQTTFFPL